MNKTRGIVLSENARLADSFGSRLKGLMFSDRRDLVIKAMREGITESSIHMMFMKYPIDVIWADKTMTVVEVMKKIPPHNATKPGTWRVYKPEKPALYVIELGKGSASKTQRGDKVEFT